MMQGSLYLEGVDSKTQGDLQDMFINKDSAVKLKIGEVEIDIFLSQLHIGRNVDLKFAMVHQVKKVSKEQMLKALDVLSRYIEEKTE